MQSKEYSFGVIDVGNVVCEYRVAREAASASRLVHTHQPPTSQSILVFSGECKQMVSTKTWLVLGATTLKAVNITNLSSKQFQREKNGSPDTQKQDTTQIISTFKYWPQKGWRCQLLIFNSEKIHQR